MEGDQPGGRSNATSRVVAVVVIDFVATTVFAVAVAIWIYTDFDTAEGAIGDHKSLMLIPFYVGVGVVIGQSWSTLLAFLPMVIALPAGAGEDGDTPLAAILGISAPIGMTLIAVGVIARWLIAFLLRASRPRHASK